VVTLENGVEFYPLTHPQKGIWYTEKLYQGTSIGIIAATLKIHGNINYDFLDKAINLAIEKNDALRINIVEKNGEPFQYVLPYKYRKIELIDFSNDSLDKVYEWDTAQAQTPLDIENHEFCKFYLLKIDKDYGGFFIKIHHTIADAWSIILIANQTIKFYEDLVNSTQIEDNNFPSYIDYIKNEQLYVESERYSKDKQFWVDKFSQLPEISSLKNRNDNSFDLKARRKTFILPGKLCKKINDYCSENKTSILTLFLCALSIYINRITDKKDIVVGTPVLNRTNIKEKETVGMFINTIPLRINVDDNITFGEFSNVISSTILQSLKHQKYSMDYLLNELREKHKGIEKLFDICLSYQNAKFKKSDLFEGQEGRWHFTGCQKESLYIHINEREGNGELVLNYDYLSDLFYAKEIDFIHDHLIRLLWHALDNPYRELAQIDMVSEKEKYKILYEFNNTESYFPRDKVIGNIFEEQVNSTPDNIALIFGNNQLSYRELNSKVNKLARFLRKKGVRKETIVGFITYRSFEMIIGILSILKAGGAYLPIDPEYPEDRIEYMLKDSNASILLKSSSINKNIDFSGDIVYIDDSGIENEEPDNLETINSPENLAYIIYTSGSTGRPKGAMIEHHSIINRLNWMQKKYALSEADRLIQKTPYTFDVSVWELMWWFFCGAGLVILEPGAEKDPAHIADTIYKNNITVAHFVPSMLNMFLDFIKDNTDYNSKLCGLRMVFASGEALLPSQVEKFNRVLFQNNGTKLHNLYGPTEATVDVSYYECGTEDKIKTVPIGKPIDNISLYILDKHLNIMPIGAVGELYIGGEGLARGYINNEELTNEKFITNPYRENARMYKTGDLARWFPKGDIEYMGRIDQQVKIKGFRIELGEIQAQLLKMPSVINAVVVCHNEPNGNKALCAYMIFKGKETVTNIKKHLYSRLPGYMIPSYFIEIKEIPLSQNGKLSIKLLPDPIKNAMKDSNYVNPRNENEKHLQGIWQETLNIENIGIRDNFFDIGGDSLAAMNLVSRLKNIISIEDIYKHPTIELLSDYISGGCRDNSPLVSLYQNKVYGNASLVCFPYGGGDSSVFHDLSLYMGKKNNLCNVFSVSRKVLDADIKDSAVMLAKEISDRMTGSILLYGHCVGSALALETARQLEQNGIIADALFIGGNFPPIITNIMNKTINPWNFQSDKNIIKFLRLIGHTSSEISKEILDKFRVDVQKYYEYFSNTNFDPANRLKTKIICITGENDPLTKNFKSRYKNWYRYSNEVSQYSIKEAKHYFVQTHAENVADIINELIEEGGKYGII
jgi:amino acid adenylation domain-containing protein